MTDHATLMRAVVAQAQQETPIWAALQIDTRAAATEQRIRHDQQLLDWQAQWQAERAGTP